jgi:hypothetical protein
VLPVLVADLQHFLDLPDEVPGPARSLAEQLTDVVRAATAADAGSAWTSALTCRRRPARRPCPGRIIVRRPHTPDQIQWQCSVCGDEGVISNWADSPYDLRSRVLRIVGAVQEIVITDETAAALRDLQLLELDSERIVFGARAGGDGVMLRATEGDLDVLIEAVAAEANHESNRGRQRRLDDAFDALSTAQMTAAGD